MAMDDVDRHQLVQQFCDVTGVDARRAEQQLESSGWDLETAVHAFYEPKHEGGRSETTSVDETKRQAAAATHESGGGASGSMNRPSNARNVRGLADLGGQGSSEDDEQMEWFTGGEKRCVEDVEREISEPSQIERTG